MERVYYKRDKRVVVEEIPDVRAVHVAATDEGVLAAREEDFGDPAAEQIRSVVSARPEIPDDVVTAFEQANWRFVSPSAETARALMAREDLPEAEEVGKPVIRANGSLAVVTNRLAVQLQPGLSEADCDAVLAEKNLTVLNKLSFAPNLYEVLAQGREDALEASVELHDDERFILAEPAFIEHIPGRFTPTDDRYDEQWQWNNTGQTGGTNGADVRAEAAWDTTRGAGIRVAVIDNGFDADHEDLAAGVGAMSGFFSRSGSVTSFNQTTAGMPDGNHGTFCAGMVGARHNNTAGGCGIAPECELMLIAALADQIGSQITLARAVSYAANPTSEVGTASPGDGADILVSSLGPNGAVWDLSETLRLALEAAGANGRSGQGLTIFWAASNGNNVNVMLDEVVSHADVIAVVRSDHNDMENNAARGPEVELIAPGVNVFSTESGNDYATDTGTSYAAPCAAGCAALALAVNPALTRDELRQIMRDTADKIGGVTYDANGHHDDYGFGRVNAHQAVLEARRTLTDGVTLGPDIALVRQIPGWASIPVAFSRGDGNWDITNGPAPTFITDWAHQPGVRVVTGDFNGNGLMDIALVRQTPGWGSIPIAFARGDGNWDITNGPAPTFISDWAHTPGVRVVTGDFNGDGLMDIALVRQTPGWASIPIAFAVGDGTWRITNGPAPSFITDWAHTPGVRVVTGDFNGDGLTDIALVRQDAGWGSIPIAFAVGDGTWRITNGPAPTFITDWAHTPGVRIVLGDFNGDGLTDIALVRQTPGWASIPIAFAVGDGTWRITNGPAPSFITDWAHTPGVRIVTGDFNGDGLTDIALVRQTPGWGSIPIAFAVGDGTWRITNGPAPTFISDWAHQPGVRVVAGNYNGSGLTDIALVRQTPGWGSIPVASAVGDGTWRITNGAAPSFITDWAHTPGVRLAAGDFHG